jgi:hypothetical protein
MDEHLDSLYDAMIFVGELAGWDLVYEGVGHGLISHEELENDGCVLPAALFNHNLLKYRTCIWENKNMVSSFHSSCLMPLTAYGPSTTSDEDLQFILYHRTIEHFRDCIFVED